MKPSIQKINSARARVNSGFTIIEIIVSLAIFSLVAVVIATALISVVNANSKAQSLKSVTDNINVAVENMSRLMRLGTDFVISADNSSITFVSQDGSPITYFFTTQAGPNNTTVGAIKRTKSGSTIELTAPEVDLDLTKSKFYIAGNGSADGQPRILIIIKGTAKTKISTTFSIQTTVSQRELDSTNK